MKHLENHTFITSAAAAAGAAAGATAAIALEPCFSLLRENICVLQGGCNVRKASSHGP
jgi:pyrimidine deaminase RibD-like protein